MPLFSRAIARGKRLNGYARQSLQRYQDYVDSDPTTLRLTFFTKLFKAEEDGKVSFNDIFSNAQSFIIAGSDTTAISATYTIWSIIQRPQLRQAILKELQALPLGFTETDLRGLPLLSQTIEEALRLYTSIPAALPRVVPAGGAEIGGYWLKEGTVVGTQAYSMHRDPEIFPNPLEFNPSRWENPTKTMKDAFMPFGRGSRGACFPVL